MSKHEKTIRRERKKTDRARRFMARFRHPTSHIPHGAAALAAAAVIAAGTQAYASPVRFDNPPGAEHYGWPTTQGDETHWLDLMEPAESQPAPINDLTALKQQKTSSKSSLVGAPGGVEVEEGGMWGMFLVGVDAGTLIPSGLAWDNAASIYYSGYGSELPEGQATYIGARLNLGDGFHYGWIGVVRDGWDLDTFAWGYETEVGVPIEAGVPEPGSLALLALGACAALRRRR